MISTIRKHLPRLYDSDHVLLFKFDNYGFVNLINELIDCGDYPCEPCTELIKDYYSGYLRKGIFHYDTL